MKQAIPLIGASCLCLALGAAASLVLVAVRAPERRPVRVEIADVDLAVANAATVLAVLTYDDDLQARCRFAMRYLRDDVKHGFWVQYDTPAVVCSRPAPAPGAAGALRGRDPAPPASYERGPADD